jgi:hypothetical protein
MAWDWWITGRVEQLGEVVSAIRQTRGGVKFLKLIGLNPSKIPYLHHVPHLDLSFHFIRIVDFNSAENEGWRDDICATSTAKTNKALVRHSRLCRKIFHQHPE